MRVVRKAIGETFRLVGGLAVVGFAFLAYCLDTAAAIAESLARNIEHALGWKVPPDAKD